MEGQQWTVVTSNIHALHFFTLKIQKAVKQSVCIDEGSFDYSQSNKLN